MRASESNPRRPGALLCALAIIAAGVAGIADPAQAAAGPTIAFGTSSLSMGTLVTRTLASLKGISVADADSPSLDLELTVTGGTAGSRPKVTLAGTVGLVFTRGDGVNDEDMEFHGTKAAINAALDGLVVKGAPVAGSFNLVVEVDDTPGTTGGLSQTRPLPITVTAIAPTVTDAPDVALGTFAGKVLAGAAAPKVGDTDSPILELELDITGGTVGNRPTFTLDGTAGLTVTAGTATASTRVEASGTIANLNAALDGMTLDGGTTAGSFNLVAEIDDSPLALGGQSRTVFTVISVTDANPTLSVPASAKLGVGVAKEIPLSVGDTDSPKVTLRVEITPATANAPTFTAAVIGGLDTVGATVNSRTLAMTGAIFDLNLALHNFTFKGGPTLGSSTSLKLTVDDAPDGRVGNVASATTALTVVNLPSAPTNVSALPRAGAAIVSWTAPASSGDQPITGYRVRAVRNGGVLSTILFTGTATTARVNGLPNGGPISFTVAAVTSDGDGLISNASAEVTPQVFFPFASTGDEVDRLHQDLLGRPPTPAERAAAIAGMDAKTLTPGNLVAQLRVLPESTSTVDPVTRLYRAYFLRIPDVSGLRFWINRKRSGASLDSISQAFAGSPEFTNRYGTLTDQAFVELVFQNVLGRPGDPGGIAFWTGQLATGARTRGQVMTGFSESNEYKTKEGAEVAVSVLFIALLGRPPTAGEFAQAVASLDGQVDTVATIAGRIIGSEEYVDVIT